MLIHVSEELDEFYHDCEVNSKSKFRLMIEDLDLSAFSYVSSKIEYKLPVLKAALKKNIKEIKLTKRRSNNGGKLF